MTKLTNEAVLPAPLDTEEGRAEARTMAIALARQAAEQAALADHGPNALKLRDIADRLEVNKQPRRLVKSGSPGDHEKARLRKLGVSVNPM